MPDPIRRHGSRRGYDLGCRCFPCPLAHSRYQRQWREHGITRVPADQVRAHLEQLIASGWTRVGIAAAAGVARTTPTSILIGRTRRTSGSTAPAMVNPGTAAALLAVPPLTSDGIRGHLHRLVESGLTPEQIADEAGVNADTVRAHLDGTRGEWRQRIAEAIAAVDPLPEPISLPAAPLLAAVAHRPLDPTDRQALGRARRTGWISEHLADRIAINAGVGPLVLVYPEEYAA